MQTEAAKTLPPPEEARADIDELTLLIAERAQRLALERRILPGRELELWLEAEAEVKRDRAHARLVRQRQAA